MDGLITKKNSFRAKNGKNFKKKERVFGPKMNGLRRKGQYQGPKRNNFQNNKKMIFWAKMDILIKKNSIQAKDGTKSVIESWIFQDLGPTSQLKMH